MTLSEPTVGRGRRRVGWVATLGVLIVGVFAIRVGVVAYRLQQIHQDFLARGIGLYCTLGPEKQWLRDWVDEKWLLALADHIEVHTGQESFTDDDLGRLVALA